MHFIVTICTGGLWLVSWVAVCIGKLMRPWRCEHCGWHKPEFTSTSAATPVYPPGNQPSGPLMAQTSRLQ